MKFLTDILAIRKSTISATEMSVSAVAFGSLALVSGFGLGASLIGALAGMGFWSAGKVAMGLKKPFVGVGRAVDAGLVEALAATFAGYELANSSLFSMTDRKGNEIATDPTTVATITFATVGTLTMAKAAFCGRTAASAMNDDPDALSDKSAQRPRR